MNITELQHWLAAYGAAWEARDPEAASRLFSDGALYFETPYAEPFQGREGIKAYWTKVTADQRDVAFSSEPVGFIGNDSGVATWRAKFRSASSGEPVELSGIFLLRFDSANLCDNLREWWHAR